MMDYIRRRLGLKLLLSYISILIVIFVVMVIVVQFSAPYAYNRYMMGGDVNQVNPTGMMAQGQGQGQGKGQGQGNGLGPMGMGRGPGLANFRAGMGESFLYAMLAATLIVALLSLFFSRSVVAPVRAMTFASQRIAKGKYDERVRVRGVDELAQLSNSFNEMAEQLEQVEAMRRQLVGDVSHELRTPLTAIKGYMEGLIDGIFPADNDTFQQIHAEADRLSRLVDDLQQLSFVESRAYVLELQPLAISTLVDTAIKRLALHAREKQIDLRSNLPADLPPVSVDPDRIMQVLTNLISNAIAYTPAGGSVVVTGSRQPGMLRVAVTDSGVGIPAEHIPHVFDRFYRVDKSRSRQAGGGSGIGLTIARHLVEAHGGSISVESAGEGQGSTFAFKVPLNSL